MSVAAVREGRGVSAAAVREGRGVSAVVVREGRVGCCGEETLDLKKMYPFHKLIKLQIFKC